MQVSVRNTLGRLPRSVLRRGRGLTDYVAWRYGKNSHESVYFYTFHKCASTLFASYALKNVIGLRHVDYAGRIYLDESNQAPIFDPKGFVYGPFRLTADPESAVYTQVVEPVSRPEFVRDRRSVFFIRDPRDILVSAYYSFGFTHKLGPRERTRQRQERSRQQIQEKSIDEYALASADWIGRAFDRAELLSQECTRAVVLRYEDMIDRWDDFARDLGENLPMRPHVLQAIHERSRPRAKEDRSSHHRSGAAGGFRHSLKHETIASLNETLAPVLSRFGYDP